MYFIIIHLFWTRSIYRQFHFLLCFHVFPCLQQLFDGKSVKINLQEIPLILQSSLRFLVDFFFWMLSSGWFWYFQWQKKPKKKTFYYILGTIPSAPIVMCSIVICDFEISVHICTLNFYQWFTWILMALSDNFFFSRFLRLSQGHQI